MGTESFLTKLFGALRMFPGSKERFWLPIDAFQSIAKLSCLKQPFYFSYSFESSFWDVLVTVVQLWHKWDVWGGGMARIQFQDGMFLHMSSTLIL